MLSAKYADCHIHSEFSFDSEARVDDICQTALSAGLRAVSVTDHCEICIDGINEYWSFESMKASYDAACDAKQKYTGRLEVCAGIELGQPHHHPELARAVLNRCDYDIVLASVHYLRNHLDFYYLDYINDYDPYAVYADYLDELEEVVQFGEFDSLAHITYPLRYIVGRSGIDFNEAQYLPKYDSVLSALAKKEKALEINTAGGRKNSFILPEVSLLKRFRELGGKYITIGSDAHKAEAVGGSLETGVQMAREAGFDRIVFFSKRKPIEIMID